MVRSVPDALAVSQSAGKGTSVARAMGPSPGGSSVVSEPQAASRRGTARTTGRRARERRFMAHILTLRRTMRPCSFYIAISDY
jgi:hypothetical protein